MQRRIRRMLEYLKTIELVFSKKHLLSKIYLLSLGLILINLSSGSKIIQALVRTFPQIMRFQQLIQLPIDAFSCAISGLVIFMVVILLVSMPFEMNKKDCSRSMSKLTLNIDDWLLSLLGKTLNLLISFGKLTCTLLNSVVTYRQVSFLTWQAELLCELLIPFNILIVCILLMEDYEAEKLFR